ncbi:hypothetical protein GQ600_8971 [Phytophthora cactorum]|nr:hypothetical protein GQ600_8971 [Phytophthora cactorum]
MAIIATTCAQAIKAWEAKNSASAEESSVIKLYCQMPPIAKLDNRLTPQELRVRHLYVFVLT